MGNDTTVVVDKAEVCEVVCCMILKRYKIDSFYVGKLGKLGIDFNTDWLWSKNNDDDVTKEQYQEVGMDAQSQTVHSLTNKYYHLLASKLVLSYPLLGGNLSLGW